jgi:hypothetical protein
MRACVRDLAYLVMLAWLTSACSAWRVHTFDVAAAEANRLKGPVRVITSDGNGVDLKNVQINADSVTGSQVGSNERVAIPQARVVSIEWREFSGTRTAMLFLGLIVTGIVLAFVALCVQVCGDPNF